MVLEWGASESAPHTHHAIADWCDDFHSNAIHVHDDPQIPGSELALDVRMQFEMFLFNSFPEEQWGTLDWDSVRLPKEWFQNWKSGLTNK